MTIQISTIQDAADALRQGRPAIFPTETVYGLGVSVKHASSPEEIYQLKKRDKRKPIAWLIADVDDLTRYGRDVPVFAQDLARTFWPGPLTLIVSASDEVPEAFRSDTGTIGLRMSNNETCLQLISQVGNPLATTSANPSGYRAPHAVCELEEGLAAQVGIVVQDDTEKSGVASTILDCTGDHPQMMREGAITVADIAVRS